MPTQLWKKGVSANPAGRKKGSQHKYTIRMRNLIADLVEENMPKIREDLAALDPKDRIAALTKLMEFVLPKKINLEGDVAHTYRMIWEEKFPEIKDIPHKVLESKK